MGRFLDRTLNSEHQQHFCKIIRTLIFSCEFMVEDCQKQNKFIENNEEKIRNHLLEKYLNDNNIRYLVGLKNTPIGFIPEFPENYDEITDSYIGRADIKIVTREWLLYPNDYYIVECKRLDGTKDLNKKYIDEGVCRFIGDNPKYLSPNNKNIMLGFIVKNVKKEGIICDIATIHKEKLNDIIEKNITITEKESNYCLCESSYNNNLVLNHIFYDMAKIIA